MTILITSWKRWFLLLAIGLLSILTLRSQQTTSRTLAYLYDEVTHEATVKGFLLGKPETPVNNLVIPSTVSYDGKVYTVTAIGERAFSGGGHLSGTITLPETIRVIGDYAFEWEGKLTGKLVLPNSLESIGKRAFLDCQFTGSLLIPSSVKYIAEEAFYGCAFNGELSLNGELTEIATGAFAQCDFTGNLLIPESIIKIGDAAFNGCDKFSGSLILPDNLIEIGDDAFAGCEGLKGPLQIPEKVIKIGDYAFSECSGFSGELTIGNSVKSIGAYAFFSCYNLSGSLIIPDATETIGERAFGGCIGFTGSPVIGESVTTIGDLAFSFCSGLQGSLRIPDSVNKIGAYAFQGSDGLNGSLILGKSVESIRNYAFDTCKFKDITAFAATPPVLGTTSNGRVFSTFSYEQPLYVLPASLADYDVAKEWSNFKTMLPIDDSIVSITLDNTSLSLYIGEKKRIQATIEPDYAGDKSILWMSSNADVAVVTNGEVTGIAAGEAIISASTNNGLVATCKVSVFATQANSVILNKSKADLYPGETLELSAVVLPESADDKSVKWTSSNEEVATVNENGIVIATAVGTTIITATATSGVFATCEVTVHQKSETYVVLNQTEAILEVGESLILTATVLPESYEDKSVAWSSSDNLVACVDLNGIVTAVSAGKAIIIATAANGAQATCNITVFESSEVKIDIDRDKVILEVGETVELRATVSPLPAVGPIVEWISSDTKVATVDNDGKVTGLAIGDATITASIADGVSAKCELTIVPGALTEEECDLHVSATPLKVRDGDVVHLSSILPSAGYSDAWFVDWFAGTEHISDERCCDVLMTMAKGDTRATEIFTFSILATDYSPSGTVWAEISDMTPELTVYRAPQLPSDLVRKGDGKSKVLIAMFNLTDKQLAEREYRYVFGYTKADGNMKTVATSDKRYCRYDDSVYDDESVRKWCYSEWAYEDGSIVTSGLRYLDGDVDNTFDGSVFYNDGVTSKDRREATSWINTKDGGISVEVDAKSDTHVELYSISGECLLSEVIEAGCFGIVRIDSGKYDSGTYIVRAWSENEMVVKKVHLQ